MTTNPRLIAVAGPQKGTVFALPEGEVSVGREASNSVCFNDPSVSRRHCLFKREGEAIDVTDLDSFNGTFVNGIPIKARRVEHGDQVAIGDTLLLLLTGEEEESMGLSPVQLDEGGLVTRSAVRLRGDESLYLRPERLRERLQPDDRVARDLGALLDISKALAAAGDLDTLQRQLLESLLATIPAQRGAILLVREGLDNLITSCGRGEKQGAAQPVRVSRTVAAQVLEQGVAILSNDVLDNSDYSGAKSLLDERTRALVCAPMQTSGRVSGIIYLETSDPSAHFDEAHLQLLTAVAFIASLAFQNVQHLDWLRGENQRLQEEGGLDHDLIGESERMREVYRLLTRVAPTDSTVLIRGESGTGKELAARAIHRNSPRRERPFIAVNCAALSESLLEAELFGHERGAFTTAYQQKRGKLEVADGGTLFLDEAGEMSAAMQAKLLRVLQEREFERVGGTRVIRVDVRLIAATNADLEEAVRKGTFRADLYYRLNVIALELPPLRQRREDIPLLASYFVAKLGKKSNRRINGISADARDCLMSYDWPGNVRELENAVERAVVLGATELIQAEDLPEAVAESCRRAGPAGAGFYEAVKDAKRQIILDALGRAGGSYTEAARLLGVHPNNLHRLVRNLELKDAPNK